MQIRVRNNQVQFLDTSIGNIVAWSWDFGDDSEPSALRNPLHTYPETEEATSYDVVLVVTDSFGNESRVTKAVVIPAVVTPPAGGAFTFTFVNYADEPAWTIFEPLFPDPPVIVATGDSVSWGTVRTPPAGAEAFGPRTLFTVQNTSGGDLSVTGVSIDENGTSFYSPYFVDYTGFLGVQAQTVAADGYLIFNIGLSEFTEFFAAMYGPTPPGNASFTLTIHTVEAGDLTVTITFVSGCVYIAPAMADAATGLFEDISLQAGLPEETGGASDTGMLFLDTAMSDDAKLIAVGTIDESDDSTTPVLVERTGAASWSNSAIALPSDWVVPFNDIYFRGISLVNGAILGQYEAEVSVGVHGFMGMYWPDSATTPDFLTAFSTASDNDETAASLLSWDGEWVFGYRNSDGALQFQDLTTDAVTVIDAGAGYETPLSCDYCKLYMITDANNRWHRDPDTDMWSSEALDFSAYGSGAPNDISRDGSTIIGTGDSIGVLFQGWSLVPTAEIDTVDGSPQTFIVPTRTNGDGTIVTGYYFDGSFVKRAFIWDATNGARTLNTVIDAFGIARGGTSVVDVLQVSSTGQHLLVRGDRTSGNDRIFYVVLAAV